MTEENWKLGFKVQHLQREQVAGFKKSPYRGIQEEELIRNEKELAAFKLRYGIEEMEKEY